MKQSPQASNNVVFVYVCVYVDAQILCEILDGLVPHRMPESEFQLRQTRLKGRGINKAKCWRYGANTNGLQN